MAAGSTNPRIQLSAIAPDQDLPFGEMIPDSRYRIGERIGRGGMGAVYEAEHVDLQKRVAVKVLLHKSAQDTKRVAAFMREARTASKISSPYIADVTDFGELPDGRVYFVMEFIEGLSVGRSLRQGTVFTPDRAIPILRQIAKGLGATHEKGVVHLDVKPDNIMLLDDGHRHDAVKMVDFGIAGLLEESKPGAKTISGTPEYVSPERISAQGYDHRSDVYSLGVVAYELLTGLAPFRHENAVETLKQHLEQPVPPMSEIAPDRQIPQRLEKVIGQCLEKDPANRPGSMAVLEGLLCEAQVTHTITTPWDDLELPLVDEEWRNSLAERMPTPGSRRRKIVAAVSSTVAVVGVGMALYFGVFREPEVIIKEVRVEVTKTSEAAEVAAWVIRAEQAIRRQQFVQPESESALSYIERAESEAGKLGIVSDGAKYIRSSAAAALLALGAELEQIELFDVALVRYREALRFLPNDPELQVKAQIEPGEIEVFMDRAQWAQVDSAPDKKQRARANRLVADVVAATRSGKVSQARLAMAELEKVDETGVARARLADGLRKLANGRWEKGDTRKAEPFYEVIHTLDPKDVRAADRARGRPVVAAVEPEPEVAPPPPKPVAKPVRRRPAPVAEPSAMKRDATAAKVAVAEGKSSMRSAKFREAEDHFRAAIAADPRNAAGYAGLAEVAFERAHYEEAVQNARRALARAPKSSNLYRLLGDAYFKLYRKTEAAASYKKALALSPGNSELERRLAQAER